LVVDTCSNRLAPAFPTPFAKNAKDGTPQCLE
jgi:hypothetical protein